MRVEAASQRESFGWPLRCSVCPPKHYFGKLKVPGDAAGNKMSLHCPNCGTRLVPCSKHSPGEP